ncbi:MAG: hypothetical protein GQ546_04290, partial [Gammaproteobacteria bacterium]|nr:hypothetical protein [Gammaproteobacteria bacterium]
MEYSSRAGYFGGFLLFLTAFINFFVENTQIQFLIEKTGQHKIILFYLLFCFSGMLLFEWWAVTRFNQKHKVSNAIKKNKQSISHLLKSSFYRIAAIVLLLALGYFIIHSHYYFQHADFAITRSYYQYFLSLFLIIGIPYCFLTLKYKGGSHYEFNDYGILLMISYRSLFKWLWSKLIAFFSSNKAASNKPTRKKVHKKLIKPIRFLKNKRIGKVYLVFLVNFFFLTLMTKFMVMEFSQMQLALTQILSDSYAMFNDFQKFHIWYLMLYHLIFYIDGGIALIGYTIASRWLNNRTKSVDMTFYGWFVVLLCYPPMNAGFTDQFIGYARFPTYGVVTSEWLRMVLMSLILFSFSIYVWATLALGFKFSNLTNRGIISHGPYRFFRHPAYASKNVAWWLDNTYVLSNIWATATLLCWNVIYMLRAFTEEKHLAKDVNYRDYMKRVKSRFIPGKYQAK